MTHFFRLMFLGMMVGAGCSSDGREADDSKGTDDKESDDRTDSASGTDDTDQEPECDYTCSDQCVSIGGTEMDGVCSDAEQTCCDLGDEPQEEDSEEEPKGGCDDPASLKEAGDCVDILMGAAVNGWRITDGKYAEVAEKEFNYVTAENEMKWEALEPNRDQFTFDNADAIVRFAMDRDMKVKGHCLVWHSQLAPWVEDISDPTELEEVIENHIVKVMDHFGDKVYAWDVVNEAVLTDDDNGDGNPRMRDSVFQKVLGDTFLDFAFQTAREQDPDVKLYYNDYSIDADNDKAQFVYEMIKGMVDRGVPIDGVGFQMHIGTPNNITTGEEVAMNLKRFADLGLEVLISEMDINLCGDHEVSWQEELYHDVTAACVNQPGCTAMTFWGISDGSSWLNGWDRSGCGWTDKPEPLLFDDNFNKKETYHQVMDALLGV